MIGSDRPADSEMTIHLQRELDRLQSERSRAIAKRDRVYANVETGDDTGHFLIVALENVKRVEKLIEQVSHLLTKERARARQ